MKKLIVLILAFAIGVTSCSPALEPSNPAAAQPAKNFPTPSQTSKIPLSESLLLVRYLSQAKGNVLTAIDPANGAELAGITPIPFGESYSYVVSPDRKTLAAVVYPSGNYPYNPHLYLVNLENWSLADLDLELSDWIAGMEFAPDSRHLAIASGEAHSKLVVVDSSQAQVTVQGELDFAVRKLKFNAAGTALMLYGVPSDIEDETTNGDPVAVLASAADLSSLWTTGLPQLRDGLYRKEGTTGDLHAPGNSNFLVPGLVFAPKQDMLYIADAEQEQLISVDFAAQSVQARQISIEQGWLEQLLALTAGVAHAKAMDGNQKSAVISPDGRFLYVAGMHQESVINKNDEWELKQTPLGLQVIRTADAVETAKFDTNANTPVVSADGKFLYLQIWDDGTGPSAPLTEVFDTLQGKVIASMKDFMLTPTRRLNGEPMLVSGYTLDNGRTQLAVFKANNSDPISTWPVSDYATWIIIP